MKLVLLAHQLRLEARHFRQFLSSQRFVERTAFVRLTQLLALGTKLFAQGFVPLGKAFADLLHLSLLVLSQIKLFEESTVAHSSPAVFSVFTSTATPFS